MFKRKGYKTRVTSTISNLNNIIKNKTTINKQIGKEIKKN